MPKNEMKWKLRLPEGEYIFDADEHLTGSVLDHMEQWFGERFGTYWGFVAQMGLGHPKALKGAIWAVRKAAGVSPNPDPRNMPDIKPGDFVKKDDDELEESDVPLAAPMSPPATRTSEPDGSSTSAPATSGTDGSPSSDTSLTSDPVS